MPSSLQTDVQAYFTEQCGLPMAALLAPIDAQQAAGPSLRGSALYSAIEKARRQDDPSVPLGAWEYELKRADWGQVSTLSLQGLQQSKDLQLVAWLLEAQINLHGFSGIAPCLLLLQQLCEGFWATLYPPIEDGDVEYRANIIRWMAEKLLPAIKLTALIDDGNNGSYCWAHWEQAQRNAQLKTNAANRQPADSEGVTQQELNSRVSATAAECFQRLQHSLQQALQAISELSQSLDQLFASDAPSMGSMASLLEQILGFVDAELHRRGVRPALSGAASTAVVANTGNAAATASAAGAIIGLPAGRTRAEAYATLAETAEFLMGLEPHSPVPYLVRRATEWGSLNTVELYQELFLRLNGQLNIFEMLGLEMTESAHE